MHTINLFTQRPKPMEACDVNLVNCFAFLEELLILLFLNRRGLENTLCKETMIHDVNL
jgi:hypothetical protein